MLWPRTASDAHGDPDRLRSRRGRAGRAWENWLTEHGRPGRLKESVHREHFPRRLSGPLPPRCHGPVPRGYLDSRLSSRHASIVEFELVSVRLHDSTGDDRGLVEVPAGWTLGPGDLLADEDGRLVRVLELVVLPEPSRVAALVKVAFDA